MLKLNTEDLEKKLGKKLKRNFTCLGLDTASRTGWAILQVKDSLTTLDFGVVDVHTKDFYYKYDNLIDIFTDLLNKVFDQKHEKKVIIEDVFFSKNVNTLKILSRIGMIAYVLCYEKGLKKEYLLATQARMKLGFKGNQKKEEIHKQFLERLKLDIKDVDAIDAIILSFAGTILDNPTLL